MLHRRLPDRHSGQSERNPLLNYHVDKVWGASYDTHMRQREGLNARSGEELETREAIEKEAARLGANTLRFQELLDSVEIKEFDPRVERIKRRYEKLTAEANQEFVQDIKWEPITAAALFGSGYALLAEAKDPRWIAAVGAVGAVGATTIITARWCLERLGLKISHALDMRKIKQ